MAHSQHRPSATSLPRDPREESDGRMRKYAVMMAIRMVCFALMVLVTPYGWYTFVFGAGAAVLPYLAVVVANVGSSRGTEAAQSPERELTAGPPDTPLTATPPVIQVRESPAPTSPSTRDTET